MKKPSILITGTRKGIGRQLVEYYLKNGFHVIGCSRGKVDYSFENYKHFELNITNEDSVKKMFLQLRREKVRLEILINNAGMASMNHILLTPMKKSREIFDTNFFGTFLVSREAAKIMKANNYGRIINITTVGTRLKLEGEAIYTASKSAVENLTIVMSREFADYGITVNGVGPTPSMTDLIRFVPKDKIKNIVNDLAFDRLTEIGDITNVIDFLISPKSDFITGQIVYLGGG